MSRSKKNKYRDYFASSGDKDTFGMLYEGMCKSEAYKSLPISVRHFYDMCRVQAKSSRGKACLYEHGKEVGVTYSDNDFVFPASHLQEFGYDRSNAHKYFDVLVAAGFIDIKENNQHRKKVNVYSFSSRWRDTS